MVGRPAAKRDVGNANPTDRAVGFRVGCLGLDGEISNRIEAERPTSAGPFLDGKGAVVAGVTAKPGQLKGSWCLRHDGGRRGQEQQGSGESANSHTALEI